MAELSDRQAAVERLVKIWPPIQLISQGHRCHCGQAKQYWFTVYSRLMIREDTLEGGCWCPACGFSNACWPPMIEFFDRIIWVNPERLGSTTS